MNRAATSGELQSFTLGWLKMPGPRAEAVGSVKLPARPDTLGEARGGLEMLAEDDATTRWLADWASSEAEERTILLQLPSGWFELTNATIARAPESAPESAPEPAKLPEAAGAGHTGRYIVRFDRRSSVRGPV